MEATIEAKNVFVEKEGFAELASYLDRLVPLLKELSNAENCFVEILHGQVKVAKQLMIECSKKNRVCFLISCRSITKRIEDITREIGRALSLIPFPQFDISASVMKELDELCKSMQSVEFKIAIADEMILEKIDLGIHERNVDRSYANELLVSIAEAAGISTERSALRKEFEDFKSEIENAQLRKDQAEAIRMDQIIALLERADATLSPEEKERKYVTKRASLGSQQLEPLQSFYCPITREVMVDPVETSSGHTFERSAIEKWLADGSNLCPLTMIPLDNLALRPNRTLRQSIEEWKDRNTMIMIASMKEKLSRSVSDSEEQVLCCLEQLQKLCEQRDLHREWLVLENYIPILVELLMGKNRNIRTHALVMLCILAKDGDDAKDRIAKVSGVIESIVCSLGRRISEGKLAVELLLELSHNETIRNCIGMVQGCILLLVTMFNSDDTKAAARAQELLDNLSFSDQNVIQMAKANYFTHLLQRLSSGSEDVKMSMVTTLAEMELTDHNKSCLFEGGALDLLFDMVSHGNPRMKQVAAKALCSLSILQKNGIQMIRQGSVNPLVKLLYNHTSSHSLQDELAAIIMHLAMSTTSNETPVPLFESDGDIDTLFSFIGCARPLVQESLLRAFYAMCLSPLGVSVKTKLKQNQEHEEAMVLLCDHENQKVRANAVKLLCCLTEDGDEKEIIDRMGQKLVESETLIRIIRSSNDEEEIASAMGVISNLTQSSQLTELLVRADGLPVVSARLRDGIFNGPHKKHLVEKAVGSLCHFTIPTNKESQKKVAQAGFIPLLVRLVELGSTSLTRQKAATSLAQLSKSSFELTQPVTEPLGGLLRCFSPQTKSGCPVHQGICTVERSFCLVEANAVLPLVRLVGDVDHDVREASVDALLTFVEAENGCKLLAEANAVGPIIKLLNSGTGSGLQEKVLNGLERIFRVGELKHKYGNLALMALVDLTQRGNSRTKSLAAKILAQLNVLHHQSSYF